MSKKSETEMIVAPTTALSTDVDFGNYQGAGYEGITGADLKIPFLRVLQSNSPTTRKMDDAYIPGAEEGMILLTVPETLWPSDPGCVFVPAAIQHVFIERVPFNEGRGFRGIRQASDPDVAEARLRWQRTDEGRKKPLANYPSGNGTEFAESYQVFGIAVDEASKTPIGAFSFGAQGKAITPFKTWLTEIFQFKHNGKSVPLFAHICRMTTTYESNDQGTFWVPKFKPAFNRQVKDSLVAPGTPLFNEALSLHETVTSGRVSVDSYNDTGGIPGGGDDVPADDIPF